eukprot:SAG22_NODE_2693_length_2307_cov_1.108696_1_plen_102_part_00
MRRSAGAGAGACACCLLAASGMAGTSSSGDRGPGERIVAPDDPALTFSGRAVVNPNGSRSFDWASQTILITISNSSNITMLMNESKCSNRYAIYNCEAHVH